MLISKKMKNLKDGEESVVEQIKDSFAHSSENHWQNHNVVIDKKMLDEIKDNIMTSGTSTGQCINLLKILIQFNIVDMREKTRHQNFVKVMFLLVVYIHHFSIMNRNDVKNKLGDVDYIEWFNYDKPLNDANFMRSLKWFYKELYGQEGCREGHPSLDKIIQYGQMKKIKVFFYQSMRTAQKKGIYFDEYESGMMWRSWNYYMELLNIDIMTSTKLSDV